MDLSAFFSFLVANLGLGAAGGILIFAIAVVVDDGLGLLGAIIRKQYDSHRLGSFLESQVGSRRAIIVMGSVATAVLATLATGSLGHSSLKGLLAVVKDAALAAAALGSAANFAAVASDIKDKLVALIKR